MADVEEKKEVTSPESEIKEEPYVYQRDHDKSVQQMLTETRERRKKGAQKEESLKEIPSEEKKENDKSIDKNSLQEEKVDIPRLLEEATDKATQKATTAFKEELQKIESSKKSEEEKVRESDELITKWEKENRLPTDWKEALSEIERISEKKAEIKMNKLFEERERAQEERTRQEREQQESERKTQEEKSAAVSRKIAAELEELYEGKFIPRSTKEGDEGDKIRNELFELGVKINNERIKKDLPALDSISKIYFMHYKSGNNTQPAGADAPVSGSRSSAVKSDSKAYIYARDHNKSYRQLLEEGLQRQKA